MMPAYEVITNIGGDSTDYKFVTEDINVVNDYIEKTLKRYYNKIIVENGEETIKYGWYFRTGSVVKPPHTESDFITKGLDYFLTNKYLYLELVSYPSIKRLYTMFKNRAIANISTGGYYYHYTFGRIDTYSDIPKFEQYFKYCEEHSIGRSSVYIRLVTHESTSTNVFSMVEDKIASRNYSCPEWRKEVRTKLKIEELMHKAYLRRCSGNRDQNNTNT